MSKNSEIANLAKEILMDFGNNLPLHIIMLKSAQLTLLANLNSYHKWIIDNTGSAEQSEASKSVFQVRMGAASDPSVSVSSSNPHEIPSLAIMNKGNLGERGHLADEFKKTINWLSYLRIETYKIVLGVYNQWKFGNTAEGIFESKRNMVGPVLLLMLPDIELRLNSITENLNSPNQEDWKNAVVSCRTLFIDLSNKICPGAEGVIKQNYIDRLKNYISTKPTESRTRLKLDKKIFEEVKDRIELVVESTQGAAHDGRPELAYAQDVVLHTYLALARVAEVYKSRSNGERLEPEPPVQTRQSLAQSQ